MTAKFKPEVIVAFPLAPELVERLSERYIVHYVPKISDRAEVLARVGPRIRAVITNGFFGWPGDLLDATPRLEIIAAFGAGYENIDVDAARSRGIPVTYGRGTNTSSVSDHAVALLFSLVRDIPSSDRMLREGRWETIRHARPDVSGKRLGIIGLGTIGQAIAKRLAGFDLTISYHNRAPRTDVSYAYAATARELAASVDFLIVAAPGGAATMHMINRDVLECLGPDGYLVNIGRGSVVDSSALAAALANGVIAGAALDVFEGEPNLPDVLHDVPNLIVTPHIAGFSPGAYDAYVRSVVTNLTARLSGEPVLTPVPHRPA